MADFCNQCAHEMGFSPGDLAGLSTAEDTAAGRYARALCEGCGPCQVDHLGNCVSFNCLSQHGRPWPRPVPPRPPAARQHCRHYRYVRGPDGGPRCAVSSAPPVDWLACMPPDPSPLVPGNTTPRVLPRIPVACPKREEWTEAERAAWQVWRREAMLRAVLIMRVIQSVQSVSAGVIPCPACGVGTVSWSRAACNGHIHARCSTPDCFAVMQ